MRVPIRQFRKQNPTSIWRAKLPAKLKTKSTTASRHWAIPCRRALLAAAGLKRSATAAAAMAPIATTKQAIGQRIGNSFRDIRTKSFETSDDRPQSLRQPPTQRATISRDRILVMP